MSQALMKAFDELLDEDPRDPETLVRRAGLYYAHQDYIKALDDINTAMKYYAPDDEESRYPAYQLRAKIYQRQKKYEDALADLNTVLKMSPQDYGTIYQRANVLYELGRYPEANADYYLMLRLNPPQPGCPARTSQGRGKAEQPRDRQRSRRPCRGNDTKQQ